MKINKNIMTPLIISVCLHAVIFMAAAGIRFPGGVYIVERTKRIFNIKAVREEIPVKTIRRRPITYVESIKFKSPVHSGKFLTAAKEQVEKESYVKKADDEIKKPMSYDMEQDLTPEALDKSKGGAYSEDAQRRITRENLLKARDIDDEDAIARPLPGDLEFPADFLKLMPAFTPKSTGGVVDSIKERIMSQFADSDTTITTKGRYASLEEHLICNLYAYEDPRDSQKYFKLSIRSGKDAEKLSRMPKEIVFLVDCSLSIQPKRLEQFKKGLRQCLNRLNPGDLFNVLAFKERLTWFRPYSVGPTYGNIEDALRFVKGLSAGENTDTYKALYESIRVEEAIIPSYIILLSDGRPTHGITDSRQIINTISTFNNGRRPIFAFSGGSRVNRYLLDFISYKNRGWSEYAPNNYTIAKQLSAMYEKIKDPLLLNLRYRAGVIDPTEVFPKRLPDFYRNAEFNLFGKYGKEAEFSLQLLGDIENETNEFIIVGSFAEARQGGEEIARGWAFNKIYHLIGLLEHDDNNVDVLNEINALCAKFEITTPYSFNDN